ncbi:uncharacterized protein LOC134536872 [Bacillus rossius redtenbacheri]|uniref:uncharacterized protein LOC134536872 n=1 Tax=Bacillus rossius redtenbacheri TaxID=93214 RepID=UPI002FDEA2F8
MGEDLHHAPEPEEPAPAHSGVDFPQHDRAPREAAPSAAGAPPNCEDNKHDLHTTETGPRKGLASALKDAGAGGETPEYWGALTEAMDAWGDSEAPLDSRPQWFDEARFRRGQQFATDYLFGLMLAEMLSLLVLFSFADGLQPLISTRKSDTPFKAFRRYLSTVTRVRSWYEGDPWAVDGAARRNLRAVRSMHAAVRGKLNSNSPSPSSLGLEGPLWSDLLAEVRGDHAAACPFGSASLVYSRPRDRRLFVNQADMAFTQFGFVGLMLVYPARFGAAGASDEALDGFAHLWRTIGYLLGVEDRYNFCAGSLAEVRRRSEDLLRLCVRPNLRDVTADWEHMSRCMVEGISYYVPGLSFETSLCYLDTLLGVDCPRLWAAMTLWQRFMFRLMWLVMCWVLRLPGALPLHNWLLRVSLKSAETYSPARLARLERRRYAYQDAGPAVCTRL